MRRVALALVLFSSRALAGDASDVAAARELATEGVILADAGKCEQAIDKLARAEKLFHAPTILGRLGECQVEVGKLVEGTENLQKVIREPLGAAPPGAFVAARARAQKVLAIAQPKIAKLTIFVEPETATVTVDGSPISSASLGTPRPTDPGLHAIEARAPGHQPMVKNISLTTSQVASITLKLEPTPDEPTPPKEPTPEPPAKVVVTKPTPPAERAPVDRTAAYVALGIGTAGLVAGTTFGLLALDQKSALDDACVDKRCGRDAQSTLDDAQRWAAFSSVGFAVGIAGLAAGTVLLITTPSDNKRVHVAPTVGLGTFGLHGEF